MKNIIIASLLTLASLPALADHEVKDYKDYRDADRQDSFSVSYVGQDRLEPIDEDDGDNSPDVEVVTTRAYADVIRAEPIYETSYFQGASYPRQECHQEYRQVQRGGGFNVPGAVIGGVIGHQFGHGNGRNWATAAGALFGGTINSQGYSESVPVENCHTSYVRGYGRPVQSVVAYRVLYRYHGTVYETRTSNNPGAYILVQERKRHYHHHHR